jgi:hypothetical protein
MIRESPHGSQSCGKENKVARATSSRTKQEIKNKRTNLRDIGVKVEVDG